MFRVCIGKGSDVCFLLIKVAMLSVSIGKGSDVWHLLVNVAMFRITLVTHTSNCGNIFL
jgi:2-methylaconitate cis-trans-isomerase PrpF